MFPRPTSFRMASTAKVVLLACGSFNPVTNMHLRMFEIARDSLQRTGRYTVIEGIISPVSDNYGKKDLLSAKHRIAMLKLALKSLEWVRCDTWETEQENWNETAKVLRHHQEVLDNLYNTNVKPTPTKRRKKVRNYEDEADNAPSPKITVNDTDIPIQLRLLCGADLLQSFGEPGVWAEEDIEYILSKHGLVCITREGCDPRKFIYESDILSKYQENIHIVTEWITNEISSTKIRRALRRGESVKYLLQDSVINHIKEHELYGMPDNKYINHIVPSPNAEIIPSPDDDDGNESMMSVVNSSDASNMTLRSQRCSSERSTPPRSPKHLINESLSPARSPQHVPCMTDIGTLVRRVKNYNLRAFQSWKVQN
ncbi:nicotinamide/nicotinic acid mononucleotide adenylyltransferase 3-like isoform X1 [Haliotis asinina]|uniref:nicotinamide/nicotinic acid mononucleotide adenylyltransferase 3-like isoform X1 n=1 Tax=Haliotis asinina TaxID=109174 RepID=UPI0035326C13